ncbi:hypothetical protein, partial [Thermomonas flagellata]|uniref:hypothetical protein n=1 Tax=Thermomonas flagellata TaxID=2888524 RepID=UPI001F036ABC
GLTQEADDLFFGKTLLHVQSPCCWGLDSRSRRYSKPGGRRHLIEGEYLSSVFFHRFLTRYQAGAGDDGNLG